MKRVFSVLFALLCVFTTLSFVACNKQGGSCKHVTTDQLYYSQTNGTVIISYMCKLCGKGSDQIIETFKADAVVADTDSNGVTLAQNQHSGDIVIFLKQGVYDKIYLGSLDRKVRLVCENGTRIICAQLNGDADGVTIENGIFKSEINETTSEVKFETASGNSYWSNIVIKNCHFEGKSYINSAWKGGVVDNLLVENCTFQDISSGVNQETGLPSNLCGVFIGENWGETIFRNCSFINIDYAGIRMGYVSVEGDTLIENCYFENVKSNACIMYSAKNPTLPDCDATLTVQGCTFNDERAFSIGKPTTAKVNKVEGVYVKVNATVTIGANKWKVIPDVISNADYFNPLEQDYLD